MSVDYALLDLDNNDDLDSYVDFDNLKYYTYDFVDADYNLFLGEITKPVYDRLAMLLDVYYIDIDTVLKVEYIEMNYRSYSARISIPPLSERAINKIMNFFDYVYFVP